MNPLPVIVDFRARLNGTTAFLTLHWDPYPAFLVGRCRIILTRIRNPALKTEKINIYMSGRKGDNRHLRWAGYHGGEDLHPGGQADQYPSLSWPPPRLARQVSSISMDYMESRWHWCSGFSHVTVMYYTSLLSDIFAFSYRHGFGSAFKKFANSIS